MGGGVGGPYWLFLDRTGILSGIAARFSLIRMNAPDTPHSPYSEPHEQSPASPWMTRLNLRDRLALACLLHSTRPRLLFVSLAIGGGTEKHVQDLTHLLADRCEVLILRPGGEGRVLLEWSRGVEVLRIGFTLPDEWEALCQGLQGLEIARVHFHHLLGHFQCIARLPDRLGVPYDFTLHDYFPICPQFNLTRVDGRYCGQPDRHGCQACLSERPAPWAMDITAWREFFGRLLQGAERVIGPSWDVIERTRGYLPQARYIHLPHPEWREIKVLVLGRLSLAKGGKQLESCARDAAARQLPLVFRVLGSAAYRETDLSERDLPWSFSGVYEDRQLARLIAAEQADLIYFPAQWPETYSYTLSAALRSGLSIVAPRFGAFEERLAGYPRAGFVAWDAAPAVVNDLLLAVAGQIPEPTDGTEDHSLLSPHAYLDRYTAGIEMVPPKLRAVTSERLDEWLQIGRSASNRAADDGNPSDRAAWLVPVEARLNDASPEAEPLMRSVIAAWQAERDTEHAALCERLSHRDRQVRDQTTLIEALRVELSERDKTIRALYDSTSWRMTRPWRWMGWTLRRLKARLDRF
ncbi:MAG: glycosyltransferase [Gammaproteobacteria bacterium]|nr:glycosyltransferase [Gammaproteobacteria bacterium]